MALARMERARAQAVVQAWWRQAGMAVVGLVLGAAMTWLGIGPAIAGNAMTAEAPLAGGADLAPAELDAALGDAMAQLGALRAERDALIQERDHLRRNLAEHERQLAADAATLASLGNQSARLVGAIENGLAATGLDLDQLVAQLNDGGDATLAIGGPLVPAALPGLLPPSPKPVPPATLAERAEQLRQLVGALPLAMPIDFDAQVTGMFGPRRDPVTGRWASHEGMDLAGPRRMPIFAAAAGMVTYAGAQRGYGNIVEIEHALGIKTRYAHLLEVGVEEGESVVVGEQVGLLGSTGRSTGPHLHYEVLVGGEPVDPAAFIRAGADILKAAGDTP